MRVGLVLGAGGVVGMAYHAGVLHALASESDVPVADADLIVGTSAGSVIGAHLRSGWTTKDLWDLALDQHPTQADVTEEEAERQRREMFTPTWATPVELARRTVGSAFVLARTAMRLPGPDVPKVLRRGFPGGIYTMAAARQRFAEMIPETWPDRSLWLCAVDIGSGRRVVFGRPGTPEVTLHEAVLASCAIPGVYEPLRAAGMTLVDGGAHSTTNLDLAAKAGCDVIIAVAPMAYETSTPPELLGRLVRRRPSRSLSSEVSYARGKGADVLMVRPTAAELRVHGRDFMRPESAERIAQAAYEATARLLETDRFRHVLGSLAA